MKIFELDKLPPWTDMKYLSILYGLEGCEVYKMLDDETKEREWNGIGPNRMSKKIRDFLDKLYKEILPAACIHDFRFVIGGTIIDFHNANSELKRNMLKCLRANRRSFSMIGYWLSKVKIHIGYLLCEKYGKEGWNFKYETN